MEQAHSYSNVFSAIRSYLDLSQTDFSIEFEISQSKISRIERGITKPRPREWKLFCERLQIDYDKIISGSINGNNQLDNLYFQLHGKNKIPDGYMTFRGYIPTLDFLDKEKGKGKLIREFMHTHNLDYDHLCLNLDYKFDTELSNKLTLGLMENNILEMSDFDDAIPLSYQEKYQGQNLWHLYETDNHPIKRIQAYIQNSHLYRNHTQEYIYKSNSGEYIIHKNYDGIDPHPANQYICHYVKEFYKLLAKGADKYGPELHVFESSCFFKGDSQCVYHLDFY